MENNHKSVRIESPEGTLMAWVTGFDPRERPERREGEAQEVPRANEAAWREVAGSHRPEGESCVAQSKKKRIRQDSFFYSDLHTGIN